MLTHWSYVFLSLTNLSVDTQFYGHGHSKYLTSSVIKYATTCIMISNASVDDQSAIWYQIFVSFDQDFTITSMVLWVS